MGRTIEFIADDFGRSAGVNAAILRAHVDGVLGGAGLMMGQPATAEAVELAHAHPGLCTGWHVHLCDSLPLTRSAWPWGGSPVRAGLRLALTRSTRAWVRSELERQWTEFGRTGLECHFINGHHHLHLHPFVLRVLNEFAGGRPGIRLRGFDFRLFGRASGLPRITRLATRALRPVLRRCWAGTTGDTVWGVDRLHAMRTEEILRVVRGLGEGHHEFMFHPRSECHDPDTLTLIQLRGRLPTS